jgi:DNA-binding transcriptional regulator GbsR (MarR family)
MWVIMDAASIEKVNRLAEEIGQFIQYWGFKSIHGKIWTHIYLAKEPIDAAELMSRLKISKSLVSITIADLLQYNVIIQSGKSARDTYVYVANMNIKEVIIEVLKQRELKMMAKLDHEFKQAIDSCQQESSNLACIQKLEALGQMIAMATTTLNAIVQMDKVDFAAVKF